MSVLVETTLGNLVIDLFTDRAPKNTLNFIKLAKAGYYNFCNFYSVEKDFVAQTGSRDSCDGSKAGTTIFSLIEPASPGSTIASELTASLSHSLRGTVSMHNHGGINRNRSEFFVTLRDGLEYLDGDCTIIGHVAEGIEVVDRLNSLLVDDNHRPFEDAVIRRVHILHDPFADPEGFPGVPAALSSTVPSVDRVKSLRIGWASAADEEKGLPPDEARKRSEELAARSRALTLEIIGDIPFYEAAPPENVLFVCRLNPVTRDPDLELVFSRFGPVRRCRVVRDRRTRTSLGYAFVEFERKESCEQAYLKMENVLVDGRRIHVDFSQSVSGIQSGPKGRLEPSSQYDIII